jgi:phosphoribosylanthranilate isomerase
MMFRIKICGITNIDDALAAAEAGANAIGLNFYSGSKRCVDAITAQQIVDSLDRRVEIVGVFVNDTADRIRELCREVGLHSVQLHGNEPPEFLSQLNADHEIIRVCKLDGRGLSAIAKDLQACSDLSGFLPRAVLVDSAASADYGGTGKTVDWNLLSGHQHVLRNIPLVLAGGLNPANVGEAIRAVAPHAVDVASGVERSPREKDHAKLREFICSAREAFKDAD